MPKGISLHIGLNNAMGVNPLNLAVNDAKSMQKISTKLGYETNILLDESATIQNVTKKIKKIASQLKEGDIFLLTYSGHGGQKPDLNGDEPDKKDETWCLYDGQLIDDSLYKLWSLFKANTRILLISDSCHSGSISKDNAFVLTKTDTFDEFGNPILEPVKADSLEGNNSLRTKSNELKCTVKLLAASRDMEYSYELPNASNGLFTEKLLKIWNDGNFVGNYDKFMKAIRSEVSSIQPEQTPQYWTIGLPNNTFDNQKPFTI